MQKFMMKAAALVVFSGVLTVALAGEPVTLNDKGGSVLTRDGDLCMLRTDRAQNGLPIRELRTFACDETGKEIAATKPAQLTARKPPDYYLEVEVMGYRRKVPVSADSPIHLADSLYYGYAGACTTAEDNAAVASAIYAGKNGEAAAKAVQQDAENRAPHTPASNESVELKSGSFSYQIDLTPSAIAADGSVRLDVSGKAEGPENFDRAQAGVCNGLKPRVISESIRATTLQMHGGGLLSDHLLGPIRFRIVKS